MLQSGATNARMTALTLGQIDATILSYPEIYIARKRGMNVLADIGDFSAYPNTSLLLTRSFHRETKTFGEKFAPLSDRSDSLCPHQPGREH